MRSFFQLLARRSHLRSPVNRRFISSCHSVRGNGSESSQRDLPPNAAFDSIKSDSPYHFYQTKILEEFVRRPANASTLRQYIFFGRQMTSDRLITAANWVRDELLTRLAHRIRDFQQLPFFVGTNPHIEFVYKLYWLAFEKLRKQPPIDNLQDNTHFCQVLQEILEEGQLVVPRLALGVTECAAYYDRSQDLDRFVNRMLRSRISRRMLAEQHLALTEAHDHDWDMMGEGGDGYVGIIFVRCSASDLVTRAIELVKRHAQTIYAPSDRGAIWSPPAIHVDVHHDTQGMQQAEDRDDIIFAYIPEHLEYILFELLSNAVRFTMETCDKQGKPYVPVHLTVNANEKDIFFRVSDQAGGIPPDVYSQLWSYQARAPTGQFQHFHHIQKMPANINERATQAEDLGPVHLGFGLIMSRVYAEFWGGELQVMSMQGYGTDAYVRIPRLGTKAENLGFEDHPSVTPTTAKPPTSPYKETRNSNGSRRENQGSPQTQQQGANWYHPSIVQRNTPTNMNDGDGWSKSCMLVS
ncbi:hypothetical protein BJV82DRAFT_672715 [Fennellomyces sp. T-0311]|nr:hypothetical protein BJV82DRAFT_672715 [Fennellomyces sp. T-0311]